ncbi:agmatine deiminase [Rhodoferax lacus]|uniref:Agmatine deiminase n=1 Tax=Rhodoferax lacus TaxID=2184758 RepID=A0A3E1RFT0_9BURK|nr:agmatine deiminase family protein [Rhodoferax lacus]RFO98091.1 agmatine deiminase [Rhodoferax lacus]
MGTRRTLLTKTGACVGASVLSWASPGHSQAQIPWRMPDEGEPHLRTWMAFGASADIWGQALLPAVQRDLAELARTIARYEPVSMLVRHAERATAEKLLAGAPIRLIEAALDDLWIRDTGPSFVVNPSRPGERGALQLNFNGWGNKQAHAQDARVAALISGHAGVPLLHTPLVLEGGSLEVDGQGTAIISESCVLNPNRNPGLGKEAVEAELKRLLGLTRIIWLPGIRGRDITDGHTDFYARFARPGVVVAGYDPDPQSYDHAVTQAHLQILRKARDARGLQLEVAVLQAPQALGPKAQGANFAAGYIGFYLCNGAVISQKFGDDKADQAARHLLQQVFAGRVVEQLRMDAIAAGGGSVHCATQQEPRASAAA